jgi:cephalosporin hydroxylase
MWCRVRSWPRIAIERFARLTGLRASPYVAALIAEDLAAFARYLLSPAARRAERQEATDANGFDRCFGFARAHFGVGPVQHPIEIQGLLDLALENRVRTVCEIGSRDGGTSVLFSRLLRPETFVVMDLYAKNRWRLRRAAPSGQAIQVIDGDSAHPVTVARLRRRLRGRRIDLLLIDGDHRWSGVRQDFINYREFVRAGGLIAFHDICEVRDPDTNGTAGDVPAFWRLVSPLYPSQEFIESPGQQGLGIGVIRYDPDRSIAPVLEAQLPPR